MREREDEHREFPPHRRGELTDDAEIVKAQPPVAEHKHVPRVRIAVEYAHDEELVQI